MSTLFMTSSFPATSCARRWIRNHELIFEAHRLHLRGGGLDGGGLEAVAMEVVGMDLEAVDGG